jgi:hypothetical protein
MQIVNTQDDGTAPQELDNKQNRYMNKTIVT